MTLDDTANPAAAKRRKPGRTPIIDRWHLKEEFGPDDERCKCRGNKFKPADRHGVGKRYTARYIPAYGAKPISKGFDTKGEASAWLDEQVSSVVRGDHVAPSRAATEFGVIATAWFATLTTITHTASTRRSYESLLDTHLLPRWEHVRLVDMSHGDIAAWIANLTNKNGLSGSTVRKCLVLTRKILDTAVLDGYLPRNPAAGIKPPKADKKEPRFLTREDVAALVRAADYLASIKRPGRRTDLHPVEELDRDEHGRAILPDEPASADGLLIDVLAATGCRWGEIAALRAECCELDRTNSKTGKPAPRLRIEVSVSEVGSKRGSKGGSTMEYSKTKSGKSRSVAIPPRLAQRLAAHIAGREPDDLAFPDTKGGPLRNTVWSKRVFRRACDLAGLDRAITIHSLRHHYASVAMSRGADPVRVARQLGHSTPTVTMSVYSHVDEHGLDDLARLFEDD